MYFHEYRCLHDGVLGLGEKRENENVIAGIVEKRNNGSNEITVRYRLVLWWTEHKGFMG